MATSAKKSRFLRPLDDIEGSLSEERADYGEEAPIITSKPPPEHLTYDQQRQRLPVYKMRSHFLYLIEKYKSVVVVGETGSGKSTQLPQYLLETGWLDTDSGIAITQPRRVAAVGVASRIAEERSSQLGQEVGYAMRFENCTTPEETVIKVVTEGSLLREMLQDPLLRKYSVIMVDEAHERSINTDCLLALLKKILKKRPSDLRLIVSSATLEADLFRDFLGGAEECAVLSVEGRCHPVEVHYLQNPAPCYLKACVETVMKLHDMHPADQGILAFLPGQENVLSVKQELIEHIRTQNSSHQKSKGGPKMRVLPLYSGLPHAEQMEVMNRCPPHLRKVIIATNIAETSVTLPGIVHVIDCGLVKIKAIHPVTGLECLVTAPASKASANQRAGRAGRMRPGRVYRLYTEDYHDTLADFSPPEIERCDLSTAILQLKALGVSNLVKFDFLSPPPPPSLARAAELIYALGGLDKQCHLTSPMGMRMAEMPLHPMASAMLLAAAELGCTQEAAGIAALMQINTIFQSPSGQRKTAEAAQRIFFCQQGDHISQLNVFLGFCKRLEDNKNEKDKYRRKRRKESVASWCNKHFLNYRGLLRAVQLKERIKSLMLRFRLPWTSCGTDIEPLLKAMVKGFFAQAAYLFTDKRTYRTIRGNFPLDLHTSSVIFMEATRPSHVLFTDLSIGEKTCMQNVTAIQSEWLYQLAPHYYQYGTVKEVFERGLTSSMRI